MNRSRALPIVLLLLFFSSASAFAQSKKVTVTLVRWPYT